MSTDSIIFWALILAAYFLPWITAAARHHNNSPAIATLNFLAGWTVVGWIIALVWACTDNVKKPAVA